MVAQEGRAQFLQRTVLDLPHALLRDAELLAKGFQRRPVFRQASLAHDAQFTLVELAQRVLQPETAAGGVDGFGNRLVLQGLGAGDEVLPVGRG